MTNDLVQSKLEIKFQYLLFENHYLFIQNLELFYFLFFFSFLHYIINYYIMKFIIDILNYYIFLLNNINNFINTLFVMYVICMCDYNFKYFFTIKR